MYMIKKNWRLRKPSPPRNAKLRQGKNFRKRGEVGTLLALSSADAVQASKKSAQKLLTHRRPPCRL